MADSKKLKLRPITENDLPFLNTLYHTTRKAEMDLVDWSEQQKENFVKMQFDAQHQHYMNYYPDCSFQIIELAGTSIGRLYLDRQKDEFRIVDIALLPEYCGCGLGSFYLEKILEEAMGSQVSVTIHVEKFNPALTLYERLGFKHIDTNGIYHFMEWKPSY